MLHKPTATCFINLSKIEMELAQEPKREIGPHALSSNSYVDDQA
jgi:hypothetical protein